MQKHYRNLSLTTARVDEHHSLKKALTHHSFYENSTDANNAESSKFIFLGMYAFKGKVAELMRKYIPLTGKQLQHYLGNIFKNAQLEKIYKKYQLGRCVRYGEKFDVIKHHHIFVYALLGFVYEYAEEREILRFIYSNFLAPTEHLIPAKQQNKDQWAKCVYLAKMYYNAVPVLQIDKEEDKQLCTIMVDNKIIGSHKSKSVQYARKKAIKIALLYIAEQQAKLWADNPIAQEVEQQLKRIKAEKEAREKAEKIRKYKEKQRERIEAARARKKARVEKARLQDMQRRKAKAEAKKRKELQAEALRKQQLAMANMSVAKRRHLQDKGILKKGAPPK